MNGKTFEDHIEALEDLLKYLASERDAGRLPGGIPKQVKQTWYQAQGRVPKERKDGTTYILKVSPGRVWRLIEKYAPDRYGHTEVFFLK